MVPSGHSHRFWTMQSMYWGLLISSIVCCQVNGQQPRIVGGTDASEGEYPFFGKETMDVVCFVVFNNPSVVVSHYTVAFLFLNLKHC